MSRILHLVNMGLRYGRSKGVPAYRLEEPPLGSLAVPCHLEESASHHLPPPSPGGECFAPPPSLRGSAPIWDPSTFSENHEESWKIDDRKINLGSFRWCLGIISERIGMIFDDLGWSLMIFRNHDFWWFLMMCVTCLTWRRVLRTPPLIWRGSPSCGTS